MLQQFLRLSVCLFVRPSVCYTRGLYRKAKHIEILSLSDMAIILVFRHQGLLRNSHGFTPNGGTEYEGVAIFNQDAAIS